MSGPPAKDQDDELIAALSQDLARDEGLRLKPYRCTAGKLSIGYGRNLDDVGISPAEAAMLQANDIAVVTRILDINAPWWRSMDLVRRRVLANMAFNMGWPRLSGFKKALAAMKAGDWAGAAAQMRDSAWAGQVGERAQRLAKMMESGREP